MNRIVQRFAVTQARPSAGLLLCGRSDAAFLWKHAALIPSLPADAAFAATTPANASDLAV